MFRLMPLVSVFAVVLCVMSSKGLAAEGDPVVATVNGSEILRSDIEAARLRLPERFQEVPLEAVFSLLLNSLVDSKLVAGEARKAGLHNDAAIKKQMARIEEQVLERNYLANYIEERITEDELKARYRDMAKEAPVKEEVRARHILLETEAQAREVISELNNGADFVELAKERSKGPSGVKGGDLGFFGEGQMVPAFSEAAFALKAGETSADPVQTQFGWHVIKLEERRNVEPPSLEEAEPELRQALSREIGSKYLKELRQSADIQRFNLEGKPSAGENQ